MAEARTRPRGGKGHADLAAERHAGGPRSVDPVDPVWEELASVAGGPGRPVDEAETPYLTALEAHAWSGPTRLNVPGHKGGAAADDELVRAFGPVLALDVEPLIDGIDAGRQPTPLARSEALAAAAWGAARTWFLVNGASQGNHAACLALAGLRGPVVVQRNVHGSTIAGIVLAGLEPAFVSPELDPELGIAHCLAPEALERRLAEVPDARAVLAVSPTYYGAVADVRGLAEVTHAHGAVLVLDEAWGGHLAFHEALPEDALAAGADLVVSSTHKHAGSLTQSAMLHLGPTGRIDAVGRSGAAARVHDERELAPPRLARRRAAVHGHARSRPGGADLHAAQVTRDALRRLDGVRVLDDAIAGRPGACGWDPVRIVVDVRSTGATGYELARRLRGRDVHVELADAHVLLAVLSLGPASAVEGRALVASLRAVLTEVADGPSRASVDAEPPPRWGPLEVAPRAAFLAPRERAPARAAVGRVVAESLALYPPGIPNVLPGERLTAPVLGFLRRAAERGATIRGAADPTLGTVDVVAREPRGGGS